jgi:hypothetical protein
MTIAHALSYNQEQPRRAAGALAANSRAPPAQLDRQTGRDCTDTFPQAVLKNE